MPSVEAKEPWYHGRKKVEFWVIRGEVMSVMNNSTSSVRSEGGGGWVGPYGGNITAPVIRTAIHNTGAFWLQDAEGKEYQIGTADIHLALRTGHKVAVLLCGRSPQREKDSLTCAVVNFTTDQYHAVLGPEALDSHMKLTRKVGCLFMIAVPAILLMFSGKGGGGQALFLAFIIVGVVAWLNGARITQVEKSLSKHIIELCKSI